MRCLVVLSHTAAPILISNLRMTCKHKNKESMSHGQKRVEAMV